MYIFFAFLNAHAMGHKQRSITSGEGVEVNPSASGGCVGNIFLALPDKDPLILRKGQNPKKASLLRFNNTGASPPLPHSPPAPTISNIQKQATSGVRAKVWKETPAVVQS